jgi:hypothetical protein
MLASGVRSSWAMSPTIVRCCSLLACSDAAIRLNDVASSAIWSRPRTGTRSARSPSPNCRAAAVSLTTGRSTRRLMSAVPKIAINATPAAAISAGPRSIGSARTASPVPRVIVSGTGTLVSSMARNARCRQLMSCGLSAPER